MTKNAMVKNDSTDVIVARDRGGRRRFMRQGAALLAVGAAAVSTRRALASDCDRYPSQEQARCSDSDGAASAGSGGDPAVCGCPPSEEVPARYDSESEQSETLFKVARVR